MRLIRMLLLPVLALTTLSAHADDKDVARLTQLLEKSQTLTARFSQLTLDGSGTQLQETAGQMSLQRPGLFYWHCLLYTSPSPRDRTRSRMPSSA